MTSPNQPATTAPPAKAPRATKSPPMKTMEEARMAWTRQMDTMKQQSQSVDWSKFDFSKLQPSDIGVSMGPMMSEEEFKEYRKRASVHVIQANQTTAKKP